MADSKLQREYTLATALVDIAVGATQNDTTKVGVARGIVRPAETPHPYRPVTGYGRP